MACFLPSEVTIHLTPSLMCCLNTVTCTPFLCKSCHLIIFSFSFAIVSLTFSLLLHFQSFLKSKQYFLVCSVVLSYSVISDPLRPRGLQPTRLLCPQGFSRQEYWSGLPCSPSGYLPNAGIEPASLRSPALVSGLFTTHTIWEYLLQLMNIFFL